MSRCLHVIVSTGFRNRVLWHWLIPLTNVLINFRVVNSEFLIPGYRVVLSVKLKTHKETPCTTCLHHAKWRLDDLEKEYWACGERNGE